MWIAKKGEKFPEFKPIDLNLSNITKKYLYAQTCLDCEPSIPELSTDRVFLRLYVEALKKNKNYTALITIEDGTMFNLIGDRVRSVSSKRYAGIMRNNLNGNGQIENARVKIKFVKQKNLGTSAYFYIVPKIFENKGK